MLISLLVFTAVAGVFGFCLLRAAADDPLS